MLVHIRTLSNITFSVVAALGNRQTPGDVFYDQHPILFCSSDCLLCLIAHEKKRFFRTTRQNIRFVQKIDLE